MTAHLPLPPGSMGLPLVGETFSFLGDPQFARKRQAQYGNLFKTNIIGRPTAFFCGPKANEFLLSTHADSFSWRGGWPGTFKELLGESLFLQEGAEHKRNRRLLMPAFHGKALESYFSVMRSLAQTYLSTWEQKQHLIWFPELKKFTFEVASVLLMGTEPGEQIDQLSDWFNDLTNGLFALPIRWGPTPYGRALRGRDRLLGMAFAKLEMKILMAQLLRDYAWTIDPDQDLSLSPVPTLKPVDGLKVTFSHNQ